MNISTYPLTESQLGMFLDWNANRASAQYTVCIRHELSADVDLDRLVRAIRDLAASIPVWKTRFVERDGEVRQFIDPALEIPVVRHRLDANAAAAFERSLPRPFDAFTGPFARFDVVSRPDGTRLYTELFHLVSDGTSGRRMLDALTALYDGATPDTREVATFADYAAHEAESFASDAYRDTAAAAKARFAGLETTVPDPGAAPTALREPRTGDAQQPWLSARLSLGREEIDRFVRANGLSTNLFFMGVFARTLALYAHTGDVVFHTVNHGRRDPRWRATQGLFVKPVPVRGELRGERSVADYFRSFRLHQAGVYPLTHFCRDLGLAPGWGFVYQEGTTDETLRLGGRAFPARMLGTGGADALPTVQVHGDGQSFTLRITALPGRYDADYLADFLARCATVARRFASVSGDTPLRDVPTLADDELASVLARSRGETLAYDAGKTFAGLFREQAAAHPRATAVVDCERALTYRELDARSDALAAELRARGVRPGGFAALMLPRTVDFPAAAIAAQKCGAGYVPLDPDYPADRLAYMLENSASPVLVTTRALLSARPLPFAGETVFVEDVPAAPAPGETVPDLSAPATPAYMIYTSGSTGRPKGVVVPNRALAAMIAWFVRDCRLAPGKRNLSITSFSFDASVPDLFPPLAAGGELHILSEALRKDLEGIRDYAVRVGATGLTTSTQLGLALVNACPEIPLDYMMLGGEKMVPFARTSVRMLNGYGPTEFAVCSSYHEVDQSRRYDIPIGRAVPNTWSLVVDRLAQPVPEGMVGELALAGPQIADGYWRQDEKTAKAFVTGPVALTPGGAKPRLYLTGDYARYDAAGELDFRGRIDSQVKLRGFRIEIGEVEHAASACEGVGAVAAEVREVAGAKHLVLYYEGSVPAETVRAKMAETLTGYMVPDFLVALERLPLTPNGKIDRRRLPDPEAAGEPPEPPANDLERRILAAVAAVLGADGFGVTHDLNRLGLTSLGAMTLIARLRRDAGLAVSMQTLTANPSVRALAAALAGAAAADANARPSAPSRARPKRRFYPMSENQRGIYADWLRNPDALQYNVPAGFRFAHVEPERLAAAARKVFAAHPALATRFVERDGEIVQERRDGLAFEIPVVPVERDPDAAALGDAMRPFRPDADVLARATVYASAEAATLFLDIHHTVFDGFSVGILLNEIRTALAGGEVASEAFTAFDAALDERDYLESQLAEEDEAWFASYVDGRASTRVETSTSGATGRPGELARETARVPARAIAAACRAAGVTPSDWFLAAFTELLRRTGRENDVLVNFVTAGRGAPDAQGTVGMFVKTLPLRGIPDPATFADAARRMRTSVAALIDRERASYARLSERTGVRPEILFAFEGGIFDLPDGVSLVAPATRAAKAPLAVTVTPGADGYELVFDYDASLYAPREMSLLLGMFAQFAQNAAARPDDPIGSVPLLSREQESAALACARGDAIDYDATRTFANLLRANAIARPFATAVVDCESSVTYGELDARSDALAARLARLGVRPGGFAALMLPRRLGFVVAAIAVQKCGAGYVPLDADYPAERLAYMLEDSQSPVLVTTRGLLAQRQLAYGGEVVFVEETDGGAADGGAAPPALSTPATPAYMIYTSGSTGRPKGVVVPNRALRHLIAWATGMFDIDHTAKVAAHPSFSFDGSVIDIFTCLAVGAELHILDESVRKDLAAMRELIVSRGITGGTMSTQIGSALLDAYPDLPLRYLAVGGEKLMPVAKTGVRILNVYGPTEFAVVSSYHPVDQSREGDIPIGRAAPGTWSLVVDRCGQLLPPGFAGELALAGPQLADGYWRLPERTAGVFVECPFAAADAANGLPGRMYRTGDLARYNGEGTLDYLGRLDFQVKLRGFRIEIGEIEHRASTFPGVRNAAAEVREVAGAKHLVLYYGCDAPVDEAALRAHLAATLTDYMVPDYLVGMAELPLTPNGKINRRLLPAPAGAAESREYVEPSGDTERAIAEVYAAALKLGRFGATDDFFASGGTSLVGIKAVVALQKRGLDVQYGDLFRHKTPRQLAAFLEGGPAAVASGGGAAKFDYGAYDYGPIDALLGATPTDLYTDFRRHSLGDVLLTGATGYLGIHVLRRLLESTDATVYALVRPRRGADPARRIDAQFVYYFGERVPQRYRERLAFVAGDITDADLADKLAGLSVGTVFNCAAMVKHYVADDRMERVNVGGVRALVGWCAASGARLVHASTYSVGGHVSANSPAVLDERHLYVGQDSDNEYVRTKFVAEREVLAAAAAGRIRAKVMRLGNLMGRDADGEFQMNVGANAFVNSLRSYRAIGAYPLEDLVSRIEMSPIDSVAEATCLLATTPDAFCVFHPYNCYALDMGAVIAAMNRRGLAVDCVSRPEFAAAVDALRNDPARAEELQGILHYAGHLLKDRRLTPAPNDWTTTVLYRLGFRWRPADDRYLANFLDALDGLAVFD